MKKQEKQAQRSENFQKSNNLLKTSSKAEIFNTFEKTAKIIKI